MSRPDYKSYFPKPPDNIYGIIYLVTHRENGKQYVGQTTTTLDKRWKSHVYGPTKDISLLSLAIDKYSEDAFTLDMIDWATSKEELDHKERFWISFLDTISPLGYNLREGGSYGKRHPDSIAKQSAAMMGRPSPTKGVNLGAEHKAKITAGLRKRYIEGWSPRKGKIASNGTRAKISLANKGRKLPEDHPWRQEGRSSWNKGRHLTEVQCVAQSVALKAFYAKNGGSPNKGKAMTPRHSRAIQCVETGVIYLSQFAAARAIHPDWSSARIKASLSNLRRATQLNKVVWGFHWIRPTLQDIPNVLKENV